MIEENGSIAEKISVGCRFFDIVKAIRAFRVYFYAFMKK